MIISSPFPHTQLGALAEYLGPEATEADAEKCVENLQAAGWTGWSTVDIPEGIMIDAALGPVPGPNAD